MRRSQICKFIWHTSDRTCCFDIRLFPFISLNSTMSCTSKNSIYTDTTMVPPSFDTLVEEVARLCAKIGELAARFNKTESEVRSRLNLNFVNQSRKKIFPVTSWQVFQKEYYRELRIMYSGGFCYNFTTIYVNRRIQPKSNKACAEEYKALSDAERKRLETAAGEAEKQGKKGGVDEGQAKKIASSRLMVARNEVNIKQQFYKSMGHNRNLIYLSG